MTLSLRDDIATLTDQKKGFEAKNKLVNPDEFTTGYNHDFTNDEIPDQKALDKFDSPSFKAERDSVRKAKAAEKEGIKNYKLFTEEEVRKIYKAVDEVHPYDEVKSTLLRDDGKPTQEQLKKFRNARLKCQIMMAYSMGLRASELAEVDKPEYAFKWQNIDLEQGTVKVTGKNNKTRKIIIPPSALLHMREWYKVASQIDPKFKNSPFVFPSFDKAGNVDISKPMSGDVFSRNLKSLSKVTGINSKRLRPHVFRHSYATHMYMHGVSLDAISKLLGHARLDTTRIYRHITDEFLELEARPVVADLDPSGRTLTPTEQDKPKGIMGQGSSKEFTAFVNTLEPEQRSSLQDVMHSFRDGVGDENKGRVYLLSQFDKLGFGDNVKPLLDREAMRLRRGQVPGGAGGVPSAAQQAQEGVYRVLQDSPLTNEMDAKIAEDKLQASLPKRLGERDNFTQGQFGKNYKVNVTPEGAQIVLDIAKKDNINIAQAYDKLVTSIETTHYALGDPEARNNFRNYINTIFPQGIGRPGEKVLFDPPDFPKGMTADVYEHHAIAQYLLDNGKLVDGDPVRTTEGRRAGLYKYAQSVNAVNKDGSLTGRGDPEVNSFVGNQIAAMEARGGEYRWSSFDIDEKTGQRVYIPFVGPDAPVYPYLMPSLSGYKVSDAEAKKKPGVLPAWARQTPSFEQAKFFADMREYDTLNDATKRMRGNPNLVSDLSAAKERMGEIKGEYKFRQGVPTVFPEFVPGLVDATKTILSLSRSFDPKNLDKNEELAKRAATKQAFTPDSEKLVVIPKTALFENKKLEFKKSAQKSALGDMLDKLNKNTPKALLPLALGYSVYEIYKGKPALAVAAEMLTPMVLSASEAQAPGMFEIEKRRQELRRLAQQREMNELLDTDEMVMRDIQAQEALKYIAKEQSRVGGLGRLASGVVSGVASFFDREDEPKTETSDREVDLPGFRILPTYEQEDEPKTETKDNEEVENPGPLQVTISPGAYINR